MSTAETIALVSLLALIATYAAYPLWLVATTRPRRSNEDEAVPSASDVAVLVAMHNPPATAGQSWRHFPDAVAIHVYDDCSTPPVEAPVARSDARVVRGEQRVGKNIGLNRLLELAHRPILVFTDDSTEWSDGALEALIQPFADGNVGCTVGKLRVGGASEGLYWRYEEWIKQREALAGEMIGATGGVFAIRRELVATGFTPGMNNDLEAGLCCLAAGKAVVSVADAVVHEPEQESSTLQWRRKVRIVSRAVYTLLRHLPKLPLRIRLRIVLHKLIRYCALIWQLAFLAACAAGAQAAPWLMVALCLQCLGYGYALAGLLAGQRAGRIAALAAYVNVTNAAGLVGLAKGLLGRPVDIWSPTAINGTASGAGPA